MFKKFLVMMALVASLSVLTACGSSHGVPTTVTAFPANLDGSWHQISGMNGVTMQADVSGDSIQVNMTMGNETAIYWMGTFQSEATSETIVSNGDPDAMAMSIFSSSDPTKTFTYQGDELSFQFTMLGATSTVRLARGAK